MNQPNLIFIYSITRKEVKRGISHTLQEIEHNLTYYNIDCQHLKPETSQKVNCLNFSDKLDKSTQPLQIIN